jgi:hypothetical protein
MDNKMEKQSQETYFYQCTLGGDYEERNQNGLL